MSDFTIRQLQLGPMANFNYIVGDLTTNKAAIIDPWDDAKTLLAELRKDSLELSAILLTHGHFDHVGGLQALTSAFKVPVYLSKHEAVIYTPDCPNLLRTVDKEKIKVGNVTIECLYTPGHSPGCQCFLIEGNLFTGDTLFVDAVGRADLPGGDPIALFKSLQKIKGLPDETTIWPGHDYGSVPNEKLKVLKHSNPFLIAQNEEDFLI